MEAWSSVFHSLIADGKKRIFVDVGACVWDMQFELMTSGRVGHLLDATWLYGHFHVAVHDLVKRTVS